MGSPTSHLKSSTVLSTERHEDKPSFKSAPDMSSYQTVETTEKRPASKVHSVFHGPDNAIFEDDIHMQHPVSDIFGDKMEMSNPFRAKDLQSDIDMGTFFAQKLDKKQEDNFVRPVTREKLDDPGIDYEAPSHLRNKIHNVGDQSEINATFQSPFLGEVGIEKKIIASVSPNNDVQYQFMLEQRVHRRLCVQKIVVATPMKDKLDKDKQFRVAEDGSQILAKSV